MALALQPSVSTYHHTLPANPLDRRHVNAQHICNVGIKATTTITIGIGRQNNQHPLTTRLGTFATINAVFTLRPFLVCQRDGAKLLTLGVDCILLAVNYSEVYPKTKQELIVNEPAD